MQIPLVDRADLKGAAARFAAEGALRTLDVLDAPSVAEARAVVDAALTTRLTAATAAGLGIEKALGYAEIVQRSSGRYDLPLDLSVGRAVDASMRPLISALLGSQAALLLVGAVVAAPGAAEQPWHADSAHLFPESDVMLPAHGVNVFVPLVDLEPELGPTELCLGSHHLTRGLAAPYEPDPGLRERIGHTGPSALALAPAGGAVVFDYRLLHRALPNRSNRWRPILYLTYARGWYRDRTFPVRPLPGVPS
jgi:ectoine hydroxylase-related dioxygenase (phytanoyl-CoA dioxygenase family)